jgi:hypothetical protein
MNKSAQLITSTLAVALLTGCAGISRTGFAGNDVHHDLRSTALNVAPIGVVEYGQARNIKISVDSPMLEAGPLRGRFEVVKIRGTQGRRYTLTVAARCDCLGFRKWSVVPHAYLLDQEGNVITQGRALTPTTQHLAGSFPKDGEYKVLVVADGTSQGKKVGEFSGGALLPGYVYVPLNFVKTSHPTGLVQVNYQKDGPAQ